MQGIPVGLLLVSYAKRSRLVLRAGAALAQHCTVVLVASVVRSSGKRKGGATKLAKESRRSTEHTELSAEVHMLLSSSRRGRRRLRRRPKYAALLLGLASRSKLCCFSRVFDSKSERTWDFARMKSH